MYKLGPASRVKVPAIDIPTTKEYCSKCCHVGSHFDRIQY